MSGNEVASHSAVTQDSHNAVNAIAMFDKDSKAIQAYKPSDQSWTKSQVDNDEIINKQFFTAVALDDAIIVLASDKTNYILKCTDVLKYTEPKLKWSRLLDRSEDGRVAAVALRGKVYAFDENRSDPVDRYSHTIETLDISRTSWSQMIKKPFLCFGAAIIAVGDFIYIFGGTDGEVLRKAAKFDSNTSKWPDLKPMLTARLYASAAALDDKIYVMGGLSDTETTDPSTMTMTPTTEPMKTTEIFDIQSQLWTEVKPMASPRYYFKACTIDGKIYAVGGYGKLQQKIGAGNLIDVYDPEADTWYPVNTMNNRDILDNIHDKATISIGV